MCMTRVGRMGFARVLVELNAKKQFKDVIEVAYNRKDASISMTKYVQVEYAWKPAHCGHCCVFGHEEKTCRMVPKEQNGDQQENEHGDNNDGFKEVSYRRNRNEFDYNNSRRYDQNGQNGYARGNMYNNRKDGQKLNNNKKEYKEKRNVEMDAKNGMEKGSDASVPKEKENNSKQDTLNKPKTSEEQLKPSNDERMKVDEVLSKNGDPTVNEWESWNEDMKKYYGEKKELLRVTNESSNEEDVVVDLSSVGESVLRNEVEGTECKSEPKELRIKVSQKTEREDMDMKIATWNIRGLSNPDKQKEVKKFIAEENLQMCAILETHIKYKKVGDNIFGNWDYVINVEDNNKGCRIMVGWNQNMVDVRMINKSRQSLLLLVETIAGKSSILLDVKTWDDETDMQKLEEAVRSVQMEGLMWGACKLEEAVRSSRTLCTESSCSAATSRDMWKALNIYRKAIVIGKVLGFYLPVVLIMHIYMSIFVIQQGPGSVWCDVDVVEFSYFGAPELASKEQLYTEIVDDLRGSGSCIGSGSQVASQEIYGTLGAIVRSQTGNRHVGFLTNRHVAVNLDYPNQKMFHPLPPTLGPGIYLGAVERATSFITDDLWYGIFAGVNPDVYEVVQSRKGSMLNALAMVNNFYIIISCSLLFSRVVCRCLLLLEPQFLEYVDAYLRLADRQLVPLLLLEPQFPEYVDAYLRLVAIAKARNNVPLSIEMCESSVFFRSVDAVASGVQTWMHLCICLVTWRLKRYEVRQNDLNDKFEGQICRFLLCLQNSIMQ
ncbi:hypothetical protein CTI12_AA030020 [Artemisia annua]|uniref:Uncharacterized protein n=1 Tax=Artemisia annua TaxID=35608 RepID=A0A2U1QH38_ARTAN|nr:hypothetical protein CTI12_AA030020 [Artemisia annua]